MNSLEVYCLLHRELLEESMLQENSIGVKVIEKLVSFCHCYVLYFKRFLNLLRLLLQNYSVNNKAFLPNIVNFTMKQIYPVVATVS